MIRSTFLFLAAAALALPAAARAQSPLRLGLTIGSSSDYYHHNVSDPSLAATRRDISIGLPVRYRLFHGATLRVDAFGAFEWSEPADPDRRKGTHGWTFGLDLATSVGERAALSVGGFAGRIAQRGTSPDASPHHQTGLETGLTTQLGGLSVLLSYRLAWVREVSIDPSFNCPPEALCTTMIVPEPAPRTVTYDRFAVGLAIPVRFSRQR